MRKLPYVRILVGVIAGWLLAGWLWRAPPTPRAIFSLDHTTNILQFSPDSRWLLTDSFDEMYVREVSTGKLHRVLKSKESLFAPAVAFSEDCKHLGVGGAMRDRVFLWSIEEDGAPHEVPWEGEFTFFHGELFFDGDRLLCFASSTGTTWDVREKRLIHAFHEGPHIHAIGNGWGYLNESDHLWVFNLKSGDILGKCKLPKHCRFTCRDTTRDAPKLYGNLTGGFSGLNSVLIDPLAGSYRAVPDDRFVVACAITADGNWCAISARGAYGVKSRRFSELFVSSDRAKQHSALGLIAKALDLLFPDRVGRLSERKQNLFILRTADSAVIGDIPDVVQARFAPDGKTLATVSENNRVSLWDFPLPWPVAKVVTVSIPFAVAVFLLLGFVNRCIARWATARRAAIGKVMI